MEKGRFLLLMMICCSIAQLHAQWDAPVTRYWTVKGHYNPAFAGSSEVVDFAVLYRYQWAGIRHAPQRVILNGHMPLEFLDQRHGAGVTAYSTTAGNLRNSLLAAQYSYILPTRHGNLHFGLHAGIHDLAFDEGSSRISGNDNESTLPSYIVEGVKRQLADLGAGIAWQNQNGYAGLSLLHLNQPHFYAQNDTLDLQSDSLKSIIPRTIHFMAGYNIRLSHSFAIVPMVWVQTGSGYSHLQTTLRAVIVDRFSGGLYWRSGDGYGFFAGTTLKGIELEYGYDHHTRGMGKVSRGSHELTLRYRFATEQLSPRRQPQKSIRLL
ncbi:MAG TPA: PorP/SprF family type IX secretion system membrane protein [Proteiniphilum sp.]|nr:PorP/SprF family type IX secretion system membrane protein [Proteiniphilum sp.]HPD87562.1 PorP/SprF family type IX secretion system membrane protein [Proteiniphilum sp.]HPJ51051.1 PorP/SprF family type IX secretion system membrane protein [Proteiniphilum sp.]HPR20565.1 PorP/SprF family type IX secretion system membrane protein [Proteiniphilum sp.]